MVIQVRNASKVFCSSFISISVFPIYFLATPSFANEGEHSTALPFQRARFPDTGLYVIKKEGVGGDLF